MIEKKLFCSVMEKLMLQILQDKEIASFFYINSRQSFFATCSYNNRHVITALMDLLHEYFPKDNEGFSELEHYIFDLEFGKPIKEGMETETFEQLYKRLINNL
jgi:hypothetical protein